MGAKAAVTRAKRVAAADAPVPVLWLIYSVPNPATQRARDHRASSPASSTKPNGCYPNSSTTLAPTPTTGPRSPKRWPPAHMKPSSGSTQTPPIADARWPYRSDSEGGAK